MPDPRTRRSQSSLTLFCPPSLKMQGGGFREPTKCIRSIEDMAAWQQSSTHKALCDFILAVSDAISGTRISHSYPKSEVDPAPIHQGFAHRPLLMHRPSQPSSGCYTPWVTLPLTAPALIPRNSGSWLEDFPPIQQAMRFGNKAFADWHAKLVLVSE